MASAADLFSPFPLGPTELSNRIVMAPMTRNRAGEGNVPHGLNALYYRQRASAGLIVTEATQISPQGVGYPMTPGIHSKDQIGGWKTVTDAVHDAGGRIFLQLWHVGRISHPSLQPGGELPVAPSAVRPAGQAFTYEGLQDFVTPRHLEVDEIHAIVEQYGTAAGNARAAGFDGVEIHAANGYLIDQFIRDGSNRRDDRYGGPVRKRARFLMEVTDAVTGAWSGDRVGVRISPINSFNDMSDSDPSDTFAYVSRSLSGYGLAYLHVVEGIIGSEQAPEFPFHDLKSAFGGTYMANGGYTRERAESALAEGRADLVSFGTLFLANPDLPRRLRENTPLNQPDPDTFYGGAEEGYTDYPALDA